MSKTNLAKLQHIQIKLFVQFLAFDRARESTPFIMKPTCHLCILAITLQLPSALKNIIDILPPILFTLLPIKPSHRLTYKDPLGNTNPTLSGDPLAFTQQEMMTTHHAPTLSLPSHLVNLFLFSLI
jgi:hypothetical protein